MKNETNETKCAEGIAVIPPEVWKGAAECINPKDRRKVLTAAQYKDGRVVSTDGKKVFSWRGSDPAPEGEVFVPVDMAKGLGRGHTAELDVKASMANGRVRGVARDKKGVASSLLQDKIEGKYPNIDCVIPKGEPAARVCFDADLLSAVTKAMQRFAGNKRLPSVALEIYGADRPVVVRPSWAEADTFGIAMPVKADGAVTKSARVVSLLSVLKESGVELDEKAEARVSEWVEANTVNVRNPY